MEQAHYRTETDTKRRLMMSDGVFFELDGKEYCNHEAALSELLAERILFANQAPVPDDGEGTELTVVLYVNCNDLFAWGCADAEALPRDEVGSLYKLWKAHKYGVDKWCCKHRGQKPQGPMIDLIKKAGEWDEEWEALPDNTMDAEVQADMRAIAQKLNAEKAQAQEV